MIVLVGVGNDMIIKDIPAATTVRVTQVVGPVFSKEEYETIDQETHVKKLQELFLNGLFQEAMFGVEHVLNVQLRENGARCKNIKIKVIIEDSLPHTLNDDY